MSAAKHTPGPWVFNAEADEITCDARDGKVEIAYVQTGFNEPFESEQQANARLICAAPDLLAACQVLIRDMNAVDAAGQYGTELQPGIYYARKAIAKATGVAL